MLEAALEPERLAPAEFVLQVFQDNIHEAFPLRVIRVVQPDIRLLYVKHMRDRVADKGLVQEAQIVALDDSQVHAGAVFEWFLDADGNYR